MKNKNNWASFWRQLREKKQTFELDRSTFFHYVVLEFLGYNPDSKITANEQKSIREMRKDDPAYDRLHGLYDTRAKEYTAH